MSRDHVRRPGAALHSQSDLQSFAQSHSCRNYRYPVADAIVALEDTNRVETIDTRFVYGEERIQVIGMAHGHTT